MELPNLKHLFDGLLSEGQTRKRATVMACVESCTLPRQTRGTDMCVNLQVWDESTAKAMELPAGLTVVAFSANFQALPQAQACGDIILLRNVQLQLFGGRPQVFMKLAPNWNHVSWQLFHGRPNTQQQQQVAGGAAGEQPYAWGTLAAGAGGRTALAGLTQGEVARLGALRALLHSQDLEAAPSMVSYLRRLCHLAPPQPLTERPACVDIKVQLLAVDTRHPGLLVLWVWDGSDARPLPRSLQLAPSVWHGQELVSPFAGVAGGGARLVLPPLPVTTTIPLPATPQGPSQQPADPVAAGQATSSSSSSSSRLPVAGQLQEPQQQQRPQQQQQQQQQQVPLQGGGGSPEQPDGLLAVPSLPALGSILPVMVLARAGQVRRVQLPEVGSWMAVKVLGLAAVQGQWQLLMGLGATLSLITEPRPIARAHQAAAARVAAGVVVQHLAPPLAQQASSPAPVEAAPATAGAAGAQTQQGPAAGQPAAGQSAAAPAAAAAPATAAPATGLPPAAGGGPPGAALAPAPPGGQQELLPLMLPCLPPYPLCLGRRVAHWEGRGGAGAAAAGGQHPVTLRRVMWEVAAAQAAGAAPGWRRSWRVVVRVTATYPADRTQWVKPRPSLKRPREASPSRGLQGPAQQPAGVVGTSAPDPAPAAPGGYDWAFKLLLEDATAEVPATCSGRAATALLGLEPGPLQPPLTTTAQAPHTGSPPRAPAQQQQPQESEPPVVGSPADLVPGSSNNAAQVELYTRLQQQVAWLTWVEPGGGGAAWLEGALTATLKVPEGGGEPELYFTWGSCRAATQAQEQQEEAARSAAKAAHEALAQQQQPAAQQRQQQQGRQQQQQPPQQQPAQQQQQQGQGQQASQQQPRQADEQHLQQGL